MQKIFTQPLDKHDTFSFRQISRFIACILAAAVLATTFGCTEGMLKGAIEGALIGGTIATAGALLTPKPDVQATPPSLDFQRVDKGGQKDLQVTIRGRQNVGVTIDRISISGDTPWDINTFSLVGAPRVPLMIPSDGALQVTVRFQPSFKGRLTSRLEIKSYSLGRTPRVLKVSLKGTGT